MRMPNGPRDICTNAQFRPPTSQQGIHRFSEQDRQSPENELGFHLAHRAGYPCATSTIFSAVDVRTENDGKLSLDCNNTNKCLPHPSDCRRCALVLRTSGICGNISTSFVRPHRTTLNCSRIQPTPGAYYYPARPSFLLQRGSSYALL